MLSHGIQVFSDDPELAPYLAHYLQGQTCNILEEEGKFYLRSSYIEQLPTLTTPAKRKRCSPGLAAVLESVCHTFDALSFSEKREAYIRVFLSTLNGALFLKYRKGGCLTRQIVAPPVVTQRGSDYQVDSTGKRIYTSSRSIGLRFVLTAGKKYFRSSDKQPPSLKKIWNLARRDDAVARALYSYEKSADIVELRKVIEELIDDMYTGTRPGSGKVSFRAWNNLRWTEPEVPMMKMEEAYALLHNPLMLGEQSLHSVANADLAQASRFKASGKLMTLQEARDIVHTILMKWVASKA